MKAGIVGAGIMGQLVAFYLVKQGWGVTLFTQEEEQNCSTAAAGLLTPMAELEKNDLTIFHLGIEAMQEHWPNVIKELSVNIYFQQQGSWLTAHPADHYELEIFMTRIASKLPSHYFFQLYQQQELQTQEPDIGHFSHAYFFPTDGQLDNQMLLQVLNNFLKNKIKWHANVTVEVSAKNIFITNQKYSFDWVFDCRGLGAQHVLNDLRGIRGELLWIYSPQVRLQRPLRFLHPRYGLYIAPRPNHIFLIGSSEIEGEDNSAISVKTTLELLTALYAINSKFSEARIINMVTHSRPTLQNHLPRINYEDGLIAINGLYRHGFLIAPTIASEILRWLDDPETIKYPQIWQNIPYDNNSI